MFNKIPVSFFLLLSLLIGGCSGHNLTTSPAVSLESNASWSVLPLQNYTDTLSAGERASNLLGGLLAAKGYRVQPWIKQNDSDTQDILQKQPLDKSLFEKLRKQNIRYVVTGGVSEWRYKAGIDGEPAVSLVIQIFDTTKETLIWSAVGSKSGWSYTTIGKTAQALMESMLENI